MVKRRTKFIYLGDSQCDRLVTSEIEYTSWGKLLKRAVRYSGAELLVMGGDLVNNDTNDDEWQAFFDAGGDILGRMKVITPTGNHGRSGGYDGRFDLPSNGPLGYEKRFYSFEYDSAHFIVLDTNFMGSTQPGTLKLLTDWIDRDLSSNVLPAVFVVMHHPMYTMGTSFNDQVRADNMKKNYLPVLKKHGVDFILCGHQHMYSRTWNIDGITQVMGVSGTKLYDAYSCDNMAAVKEFVPVFTVFEIDFEEISMKTFDGDGRLLDTYAKEPNKKGGCRTCKYRDKCLSSRIAPDKADNRSRHLNSTVHRETAQQKYRDGIIISGRGIDGTKLISSDVIANMPHLTSTYSVGGKKKARNREITGVPLLDILYGVGWTGEGNAITIISEGGYDTSLLLNTVIDQKSYAEGSEGRTVPAIIFLEDEKLNKRTSGLSQAQYEKESPSHSAFRLAFGQTERDSFNGRNWVRNIIEIDILMYK